MAAGFKCDLTNLQPGFPLESCQRGPKATSRFIIWKTGAFPKNSGLARGNLFFSLDLVMYRYF